MGQGWNIRPHKEFKATACPGTLDIPRLVALANGIDYSGSNDCEKELRETIDALIGVRESRKKWKENHSEEQDKRAEEGRIAAETIEKQQKACTRSAGNMRLNCPGGSSN